MNLGLLELVIGFIAGVSIIIFGISAPLSIPILLLLSYTFNEIKSTVFISDVFFALLASFFYKNTGKINYKMSLALLSGLVGIYIGIVASTLISDELTIFLVGIFELISGVYIYLGKSYKIEGLTDDAMKPIGYPILLLVGATAGFFKGFLGMGWGPILLSLLIIMGFNPQIIIGSAFIPRILVTLFGGVTYISLGDFNISLLLSYLTGGIIGIIFAIKLIGKLDERNHRRVIGILISLLGLMILLK